MNILLIHGLFFSQGNGVLLIHKVPEGQLRPGFDNEVEVRFWPGQWYKNLVPEGQGGSAPARLNVDEPASREEILMALDNLEFLLIK